MHYDLDIEFIGGPYDGYHHLLDVDTDPVLDQVDLPVSQNVIRMAAGRRPGPSVPCQSVATYQLRLTDHHLQYRFSRYRAADRSEAAEMANWYQTILKGRRDKKSKEA